MQEMFIPRNKQITFRCLAKTHAFLGFKGPCIVRFYPEHYKDILDLPGFRLVDDYRITKPIHNEEIGFSQMFHMVFAEPMDYSLTEYVSD